MNGHEAEDRSLDDPYFRDAAAQFSIVGPPVSEADIHAVIPGSFPGKDDLVQFYLRCNGGSRTPQGCLMHCGDPAHRVSRDHLEKLNLEGFRSINVDVEDRMLPFANLLRHHRTMAGIYGSVPEMRDFLESHLAIAFDHSGNDLCVNLQDGRIVFMDWKVYKEGAVGVAGGFRAFVLKFWNHAPAGLH